MIVDNRPLKVGLVGPLPPPFGGMANQAGQLSRLLQEEGLTVCFIQTNSPYVFDVIKKITGLRAVFRMIPYLISVWKVIDRVDVLHVLSNSGWSWQLFSAPVLWMGWLKNKPVIVNYRGGEAQSYFSKSIRWVRPSMNKAAVIVVPSAYLKKVFADYGFESKIIPNIIDLERFTSIRNKRLSIEAPHLIVARNLEPIYGIKTAIETVAILKNDYPKIKLSIAGSGPQKEELEDYIKNLGLNDQVILTGKLAPDEVIALYHSADIMLNPTTVDNMPNSILESWACGVPVVTTNVGGIPYIVEEGNTALLTNVDDPQSMAEKIDLILQDRHLYQELRNNGLREVQRYAWPEIKQQWLTLYQSLVSSSGPIES